MARDPRRSVTTKQNLPAAGTTVLARWTQDDQWYTAQVERVLPSGKCFVRFVEYRDCTDTLPLDRLRPVALQSPAAATAATVTSRWKVGDIVEGRFSEDGEWYGARVDGVLGGGRYFITFVDYSNSEEAVETSIRPLPQPVVALAPAPALAPDRGPAPARALAPIPVDAVASASRWKAGDVCEGQFSEDNQWYRARIDKVLGGGRYVVTYTDFGNSEESEDQFLRPQPGVPVPAPVPVNGRTTAFRKNDMVEVLRPVDERWTIARVNNVSIDGRHYKVAYGDTGLEDVVTLERVRPAPPPNTAARAVVRSAWRVGDLCEAMYSEDGVWYEARILEARPNGTFFVIYTEYDNTEERPLQFLRPLQRAPLAAPAPVPAPVTRSVQRAPAAPAPAPAPVPVPAPVTAPSVPAGPATPYNVDDVIEGKFTGDNTWYTARIVKVLDNGRLYEVVYTEYDNSELLPLERIRRNLSQGKSFMPVTSGTSAALIGTVQQQLDMFVRKYQGVPDEPAPNANELFVVPPEESEIATDRQTRYTNRKKAVDIFGPRPENAERLAFSDIADALPDQNAAPVHINHLTSDLPITPHQNRILHTIEKNQVAIIKGSTGSGKTTQVPQYILDAYQRAGKQCNIVCTQPRRIAAISISRRVCEERNVELGGLVGYQVGMDKKASSDNTRLLYVTTGVLLQRLIRTKTLRPFTHVIIDEVHERDKDTDFVLLIVRELLRIETNVRVVLMSATIDTEIFQKYFSSLGPERFLPAPDEFTPFVPEVNVEGRLYQVKIHYLDKLDGGRFLYALPPHAVQGQLLSNPEIKPEMFEAAVELIIRICRHEFAADHERNDNRLGSILVFLPGLAEIQELYDLIDERIDDADLKRSLIVLPLHSTLNSDEQQRVFRGADRGMRKIIIATNIAESSITVPDVRYVVDFCLVKEVYCDQNTKLEGLRLAWASQSACVQRSGRAGRVQNGVCFRLIPSRFFEQQMFQQATPEIQRTSLDHLILQVKVLKVGDPRDVLQLAMQPPNISNIEESLTILTEAGALANEPTGNVVNFLKQTVNDPTGRLTRLGEIYAALPVDIRLARLVVFGIAFDLPQEALIMAACMSLTGTGVFSRPFQRDFEFFKMKLQWAGGSWSDAIAGMRAFETWRFLKRIGRLNTRDERNWARRYFINLQKMREAEDIMKDLTNRLDGVGIQIPERATEEIKKTYWTVLSQTTGADVDVDQLFRRDEADLTLLKLLLCAAFYPNFLLSMPSDKRDLMYAKDAGFNQTLNYDPWRTIILRSSISFPHNVDKHIEAYFRRCGKISKLFIEGAKCFIEFENPVKGPDGRDLSLTRDPRTGKIVIPDVPMAVYHAYKCWQMERRRNRLANEKTISRDPKDYIGAHEFEFPFQLRFTKFAGFSNIKVHNDSVNCVVFCKDPSYAERYVMVSPSLATSSGMSSDLQASNTTLLEGRPLLPALLCMLFTHTQTELMPSNDNTTYAGVRIGNYEFNFDARFGERDVQLINSIRDDLEQLVIKDLFDREQLRERSLTMKRRLLELIAKPRKLNEITKSFLNLTVDSKDWTLDADTAPANADLAWEEDDSKANSTSTAAPALATPAFKTRVGFVTDAHRPLSERVQRLGLTDKNLFPKMQPLGLKEHGENGDEGEDMVLSTRVETVYDRIAKSTLESEKGLVIVCRTCDAPVAPFSAMTHLPNANPRKPNDVTFKLDEDKCRGMAFYGLKGLVMCKGGHPVGTYEISDRVMKISVASNVRVQQPDGRFVPWEKKVWEQLIGGSGAQR